MHTSNNSLNFLTQINGQGAVALFLWLNLVQTSRAFREYNILSLKKGD